VWTEQEIAVAAYIKYVENREIPVIAFTHESVTREGIRDQLHMNPISFRSEEEVLAKLPARLRDLVVPAPPTIALRFESVPVPRQAEHTIRQLQITVFNGTNVRISTYNGKVWIPKPLLIHWDGTQYSFEDKKAATETHRCFQFSEHGRGAINPQDSMPPFVIEYCTQCAVDARNLPQSVSEMEFEASAWVNGRKYSLKRSLIQLSQDATR
ncbi:MAG: hypothetical protein ACRD41_03200, partial [Candidatus Acidiferrales bacterium]